MKTLAKQALLPRIVPLFPILFVLLYFWHETQGLAVKAGLTSSPTIGCKVAFEGSVKKGKKFQHDFSNGLRFLLDPDEDNPGTWIIEIIGQNLKRENRMVFPVNPPYRTDEHLMIGAGYDKTARESIEDTPREFFFLYRPEDVPKAFGALEKVMRPQTKTSLNEGSIVLKDFPQGKGTFKVVSVKYEKDSRVQPSGESINELKFMVCLDWPVQNPLFDDLR